MVNLPGMPPPPYSYPDPMGYRTFADWVKEFTRRGSPYGVNQKMLALAAGKTPQSVTKWIRGGGIEVETLARISAWTALPYQQLRNLVDERLLSVANSSAQAAQGSIEPPTENALLASIWNKLNPRNRAELIGMAKTLLSQQNKKSR